MTISLFPRSIDRSSICGLKLLLKPRENTKTEELAYKGKISVAKKLISSFSLPRHTCVLLVEDNSGDILPTLAAFNDANPSAQVYVVRDGIEAVNFLMRRDANSIHTKECTRVHTY